MAYGGSNDDVIDDVTWPSKVKVVIPLSLRPVISRGTISHPTLYKSCTKIHLADMCTLWAPSSLNDRHLAKLQVRIRKLIASTAQCVGALLCRKIKKYQRYIAYRRTDGRHACRNVFLFGCCSCDQSVILWVFSVATTYTVSAFSSVSKMTWR